jgi:hypothetical protein
LSDGNEGVGRHWRNVPIITFQNGWQSNAKPRYAEIEAAERVVKEAKAKLIEIENAYLAARGYSMVVDHEESVVEWQDQNGDIKWPRSQALAMARMEEANAKREAEAKIRDLKAEHGIEG